MTSETTTRTRKRLLYLITKGEFGGAQTHVRDLIEGFAPHYDVHLATGLDGPLVDAARAAGAQTHLLSHLVRSINPFADSRSVRECVALIRAVKPDLIHAHSSKAGIVGRCAARICGVPAIFTAHGWGFSPGSPSGRAAIALLGERMAAPLAQKIICVSENDRQLALKRRLAPEARLATIRCALSATPQPQADPSTQPPRFVMVARFSEQKDQTTLLRAVKQVRGDFHVDLIGTGPKFEILKQFAQELGVEGKVSFLGDRSDVPELLAQSQCFVLSTNYEGLPISILEAMRAGLPVIATDAGGISEEVAHEETGFLVPRGDETALANALQTLRDDPDRRSRMGIAGREKFLREFTLDRLLSETKAVYDSLLQGTE
jgi:glycosyltransferase involved in cell wall biosynthesis